MTDFILKYWLEVVFSAILFIMGALLKKVMFELKCEMREQKAIKAGIHALLRDQLIRSYNYFMEKGELKIHDRDNLSNLYKQYHELGANGVIDGLIKELMELPIKRKEVQSDNK